MREHAILFGRDRSLVGVLTENRVDGLSGERDPVCVLLLSSGLDHHVGPNRIYVKLARRVADIGFPVFRFSFSGIGDSGPRRDKLPASESVIDETQQAMDFLAQQKGIDRFIAIGLCNGAAAAFQIAALDRRIRGAVLINPPVPEISREELNRHSYYWNHALFNPNSWKRLLLGRSFYREILRSVGSKLKNRILPSHIHSGPNAGIVSELSNSFRFMQEHKTQVIVIDSDEVTGDHYFREFMRKEYASLKDSGLLSTRVLDGADHVVTPLASQECLLKLISEWIVERFGSP